MPSAPESRAHDPVSTVTRRIAWTFGILIAVIVLALGIPGVTLFRDAEMTNLRLGMERDALVLADDLAGLPAEAWRSRLTDYENRTGARLAVVNASGLLVFDTEGAQLGVPFTRPEITEALTGRVVAGVRPSVTLGQSLTYAAVPVRHGGETIGALRMTMPASTVDAKVDRLQVLLIAALAAVLAVSVIVSWAVASVLARPLAQLATAARDVGNDPSRRVGALRGPRDVRSVAEALDETAAKLDEAIARSRSVAEESSHHLRTPLAALRLRVEALSDLSDGEAHGEAEAALVEIDRLNRRIEQILAIARGGTEQERERVDVAVAVTARIPTWVQVAEQHGITVHLDEPAQAGAVLVAPGTIERTLDELVGNALQYADTQVDVAVEADDEWVSLRVQDDGPGIPVAEYERIFERFRRGSQARSGGSGLGLAMVREAARTAGGDARVVDGKPGACIQVQWPVQPDGSVSEH